MADIVAFPFKRGWRSPATLEPSNPATSMGGSAHALVVELLVMAAFVAVAVLGFKFSPWLIVAGLAGHGVFDVLHPAIVPNPGVPQWWPAFCLAFDVGAAALLGLLLRASRASQVRPATPAPQALA